MSRIRDLEAENAQLRLVIQQSAEVTKAVSIVQLQDRFDDLSRRCTEMIAKLREGNGIVVNFGHCPWCEASWPHSGSNEDRDEVMRLGYEHDNKCPKNPIRIERDAMRDALVTLGSLQLNRRRDALHAWAIRETANRTDLPFTMERVEALVAEYVKDEEAP